MENLFAKAITLAALFGVLICCSGCAGPAATAPAVNVQNNVSNVIHTAHNPRYRILPGDDLEIKLTYHSKFSEKMEVLPDGWITLPLVGPVEAAGKSPQQLAGELESRYARELKEPEVIVIVRQASGRLVYVGGEVKLPRALPLNFPVTLLQAIIQCGDTLPSAHKSNVLILRAVPGQAPQALVVDLDAIRDGESADIPLEPYDVVHIPKTAIAKAGDFIDAYINRIIPQSVNFPFIYELHDDERH